MDVIKVLDVRWDVLTGTRDQHDLFADSVGDADLVKDVGILFRAVGEDDFSRADAVPDLFHEWPRREEFVCTPHSEPQFLRHLFHVPRIDSLQFARERHQNEDIQLLLGRKLLRSAENRHNGEALRMSRDHGHFVEAHATKGVSNHRREARVLDGSGGFGPVGSDRLIKRNEALTSHVEQLSEECKRVRVGGELRGVSRGIPRAQSLPGVGLLEEQQDQRTVVDFLVRDVVLGRVLHRESLSADRYGAGRRD